MGDISIIARRLPDGRVQYGWSGNGGYCRTVGVPLLKWYNTPEMVDYLFGLGQLSCLAAPLTGEYEWDEIWHTTPIGRPHFWADSEQGIYRGIAYVDYAYFYDVDQRWYYLDYRYFNIKIPLESVWQYLARTGEHLELKFFWKIHAHVFSHVMGTLYEQDEGFRALADQHTDDRAKILNATSKIIAADLTNSNDESEAENLLWNELYPFFRENKWIYDYLDRWAVVIPTANGDVEKVILRKREEPRKETIEWT